MENPYNNFATFSQDNIDAFVRANAAFTRGFEQISNNFVALATRSLEEAVEAGKRFSAVKSVPEAIELQTKFVQESFETLIAEAKKAQDLSASIVKEASAPLAERFKAAVVTGAAVASTPVSTSSTKKAA